MCQHNEKLSHEDGSTDNSWKLMYIECVSNNVQRPT